MKRMLVAAVSVLLVLALLLLPCFRDFLPFDPVTFQLYPVTRLRDITPTMIRDSVQNNAVLDEDEQWVSFQYDSLDELRAALGFDLCLPEELPDGWRFAQVYVTYMGAYSDEDESKIFLTAAYKQDPSQVNPIRTITLRAYSDISELYVNAEQSEPGFKRFICGVPVYIYRNIERWGGLWTVGSMCILYNYADDEESLIPYLRTILEGRIPQDEIAHSAAGS